MSKTVSTALWVLGAIAAVALAVYIIWPSLNEILSNAMDSMPTFPTTPTQTTPKS